MQTLEPEYLEFFIPVTHSAMAPPLEVVKINEKGDKHCSSPELHRYKEMHLQQPFVVPNTCHAALCAVVSWANGDVPLDQVINHYSPDGTILMGMLRAAYHLGMVPLFNVLCLEFGKRLQALYRKPKGMDMASMMDEMRRSLGINPDPQDQVNPLMPKVLNAVWDYRQTKMTADSTASVRHPPKQSIETMAADSHDTGVHKVLHDFFAVLPQWKPNTKACEICNTAFGTFYNKHHHCRACGKNVCSSCTKNLNKDLFTPILPPEGSAALKHTLTPGFLSSNEEYVCPPCYLEYTNASLDDRKFFCKLIESTPNIDVRHVVMLLPMNNVLLHVCGKYLQRMRELAVHGWYSSYTENDAWLVRANMSLFDGHRIWILLALMATDWDDPQHFVVGSEIQKRFGFTRCQETLTKDKLYPCRNLFCSRECCEMSADGRINSRGQMFSPMHALVLLKHLAKYRSSDVEDFVRQPILQTINSSISDDSMFLLYLPLLLDIYAENNAPCLRNMLIDRASLSRYTMWNLLLALEHRSRNGCVNSSGLLREGYFMLGMIYQKGSSFLLAEEVTAFYLLTKCFRESSVSIPDGTSDVRNQHCMVQFCDALIKYDLVKPNGGDTLEFKIPMWFPFLPEGRIVAFERIPGTVRVMKSKTAPVCFTFITSTDDGKGSDVRVRRSLLWKNESVLKDTVICNMIGCISDILSLEGIDSRQETPSPLKHYHCLQISNDGGIVEWMEDLQPLQQVGDLHTYLRELKVDNKSTHVTFAHSLAVYTCLTYVFGVTDRHKDNIMIHAKTGNVLDIDFGFIFSRASMVEGNAFLRFDAEYVKVLKSADKEYETFFNRVLQETYHTLRRQHALIYLLMNHVGMHETKWSSDYVFEEVMDRCCPGSVDSEAFETFDKRKESALTAHTWKDFFHSFYVNYGGKVQTFFSFDRKQDVKKSSVESKSK